MKKILIVLFAASIVVACTNEPKIDYALISGKIDNPVAKTVSINGYGIKKTFNLNDDNTFTDTLKITYNGYYTIIHGKESSKMYIDKGNNLHITLNTKEFDESITYTGIGAEASNYLAAKALYQEKLNILRIPPMFGRSVLCGKNKEEFLKEVEKLKTHKEAFLSKAEGLSKNFRTLEEKSNQYNYLSLLLKYKTFCGENKTTYKNSKEFNEPFVNINYTNDDDYRNFKTYRNIVNIYYIEKFDSTEDLNSFITEVKSIPSVNIKNAIARKLVDFIFPGNEQNEILFKGLTEISTQEKFKNKLKETYQKVSPLVKGMPSPVFVNYENHKGTKTSLEDFRGKYVYIDVWATWCQPCKNEIPFLKEVESKYHNKNIEFVSISVDKSKDYDAWVQMVKDKKLGGVQLIADNDFNSDFVKKYNIEFIPRFILIDPEGNIINAGAPKPSNPKLIELFNELKL